MPTIKERVEHNVTVWLLSTLLTGFLAGIGVYSAVQDMAGLSPVPATLVESLRQRSTDLEARAQTAEAAAAAAEEALRQAYDALVSTRVRVLHLGSPSDGVRAVQKRLQDRGGHVTLRSSSYDRSYYGVVYDPSSSASMRAGVQAQTLLADLASLPLHRAELGESNYDVVVWLPPDVVPPSGSE